MGMFSTLLFLTIIYALALFILIPIVFLLGAFATSLFESELFTQEGNFLFHGMFFITVSLFFDFIAVLILTGFRSTLDGEPEDPRFRRSSLSTRILYISIPFVIIFSYLVSTLFFMEGDEAFFLFLGMGILLAFFFMKWKVIDIPAKSLALIGNEGSLKRSRMSAVPFVIFLFSFMAILFSFRFEDAPFHTIIIVYLEFLFSISILINLINIGGVVKDIGRELGKLSRYGS